MAYGSWYDPQVAMTASITDQFRPLLWQNKKQYYNQRNALTSAANRNSADVKRQADYATKSLRTGEINNKNAAFKASLGRGVGGGIADYQRENIAESYKPQYQEIKDNSRSSLQNITANLRGSLDSLATNFGANQANLLAQIASTAAGIYNNDSDIAQRDRAMNAQLDWDKNKFGQQLSWDKNQFGQQLAWDKSKLGQQLSAEQQSAMLPYRMPTANALLDYNGQQSQLQAAAAAALQKQNSGNSKQNAMADLMQYVGEKGGNPADTFTTIMSDPMMVAELYRAGLTYDDLVDISSRFGGK